MFYFESKAPESACARELFCIWGCYAIVMTWLWNGLTAAGFPAPAIWALAGAAGLMLLQWTREA